MSRFGRIIFEEIPQLREVKGSRVASSNNYMLKDFLASFKSMIS